MLPSNASGAIPQDSPTFGHHYSGIDTELDGADLEAFRKLASRAFSLVKQFPRLLDGLTYRPNVPIANNARAELWMVIVHRLALKGTHGQPLEAIRSDPAIQLFASIPYHPADNVKRPRRVNGGIPPDCTFSRVPDESLFKSSTWAIDLVLGQFDRVRLPDDKGERHCQEAERNSRQVDSPIATGPTRPAQARPQEVGRQPKAGGQRGTGKKRDGSQKAKEINFVITWLGQRKERLKEKLPDKPLPSQKKIAEQLKVSVSTVSSVFTNLKRKHGASFFTGSISSRGFKDQHGNMDVYHELKDDDESSISQFDHSSQSEIISFSCIENDLGKIQSFISKSPSLTWTFKNTRGSTDDR